MEFPFNCAKILGTDSEGYTILDGKKGANQGLLSQGRVISKAIPEV